MLFKPELCEAILKGRKTQTRRLVKPKEVSRDGNKTVARTWSHVVLGITGHRVWVPYYPKWQVGRTYAIQPGRGKKAVGRFLLLAIRRESLQDITEEDAIAEGIRGYMNHSHSGVHSDPHMIYPAFPEKDGGFRRASQAFEALWDSINTSKGARWEDNPKVWVLEFEVANKDAEPPMGE